MTVYELNHDQLNQVKVNYYTNDLGETNGPLSYGDLLNIDGIVSNDEVYDAYAGVDLLGGFMVRTLQ